MNSVRWLVVMTILLSSPAQAFFCFEPSPTYLQLGESYFDDEGERILVRGDERGLEKLHSLQGEWEGRLSELICEGTREQSEAYFREAEVEADVRDSNTALFLISLSKEYDNSYISSGDRVFLMNKGSMYSLRISDKGASARERERRGSAGKRSGSRYVEVFSEIMIHDEDEITVEWWLFSNGYFVYSQRLTLERDL